MYDLTEADMRFKLSHHGRLDSEVRLPQYHDGPEVLLSAFNYVGPGMDSFPENSEPPNTTGLTTYIYTSAGF